MLFFHSFTKEDVMNTSSQESASNSGEDIEEVLYQ